MLSSGVVVAAGLGWLGLLFAAALYGERRPRAFERHWAAVYALSLAVYCTSWTFFGTVTQAARYDWPLPPTFVGTIALYVLGIGMLLKLVRLVREHNATSLADFIATRLGKDGWLAAVVTLVAVLGIVPYIALQLKAVAMSFALLVRDDPLQVPAWQDSALYVALAMAAFAMLFGTRSASAAEHNRGLVLAMAFEALLKLAAMLALGVFVLTLPEAPAALVRIERPETGALPGFAPLVLLGVLAMFTLPHQFHVGAVECRDERHVRAARWLFPLYMLLIALPLLPLARAGDAWLGASGVPSDLYVLALPLSQGNEPLALLAFLGGLSAGTGMVIVATLALSLMIGNHWLTPLWLHGAWSAKRVPDMKRRDLRGAVLIQRRIGILAIVLLAWGYSRLIAGNDALADVGALSFSALGTLAPAVGFAMWRPQTPPRAVIAGIVAAVSAWSWLLLVPVLVDARGGAAWLQAGPWSMALLAPDGFMGLTGWSRLGRAVGSSLFFGVVVTWSWAGWSQSAPRRVRPRGLDADTLREVGLRFLPSGTVDAALGAVPRTGVVSPGSEARLESELAAVLGASSARLLLDAARRETGRDFDTVAAIVGEASQDLRFNQRLLEAALQNMSQGISVVDAQLRLVAWNRRYAELFGYPESLLQVGRPVEDLSRWALQRIDGDSDVERALRRRLAHMRAGTPHLSERVFPDGSIVEIRGNPMPGGGFVATFTEVTAFREAEQGLRRANETLEQRVGERTALLESAKREAERANEAKSRFLAAIGHDLLQPLHAAHLFTDALGQQLGGPGSGDAVGQRSVAQIRGALDSTTDLLTGLLDMSRLEAGGLVPECRDFPLAEILDPLASEFRALAAERGLGFRHVPTRAWVHTDPQLLRRVLQNFLANAVRYTVRGSVLLGVRRDGARLRVEVHDTGPGIPRDQHAVIFEEFRRGGGVPGQGLGIGLAIAERISELLQAPLALRSAPGAGTMFAVSVPMAAGRRREDIAPPDARVRLPGLHVLVVDNEALARHALRAMLEGWGCRVSAVADGAGADAVVAADPADAWLFDYHLDDGDTGVALYERLARRHGAKPAVILSADHTQAVRRAVHEAGLPLLMKPLKPLALKSVLDRVLASRTVA